MEHNRFYLSKKKNTMDFMKGVQMLFTNFKGFGSNKKEKAYGLALCFDLLAYWLERNGRGVRDKFVLFRFFLLYCIFFGGLLILFLVPLIF